MTRSAALLAAALLAIHTAGLPPAFAAEKPIRFAVAAALTGKIAPYGENIKAGVELKIAELNAKGGVNGRLLEPVWQDDACEPKEAAVVAAKIAQDPELVAVIGHLCSSAHLAALPTYVKRGVPSINPTASNVAISDKNRDKTGKVWSFRLVYRDDVQGAFLARYAKEALRLASAAVFHENNDYGLGLKDAFVAKAGEIGLPILAVEAYTGGAVDFAPQITALKDKKPAGLFLAGYHTEAALIAEQAAKLGLEAVKFGADGLDNEDFITLAGPAAEGVLLTVPFLPAAAGPEARDFLAAYDKRFNRAPDYMAANAYDAVGLLAKVLETTLPDRNAIRDALSAVNSPEKAYLGVAGKTFFNAKGDSEKPAFVKQVKNGAFVPAEKQLGSPQ